MWVPESATESTVRKEDLPQSLFPVRTVPLSEHNPEELQRLAERPQRLLPVPEVDDPGKQRRLANLAQYRGRTLNGQKRALGNMPRKIKSEHIEAPEMSTEITAPVVPAATPMYTKVEDTFRGKLKRTVLSQDEWNLYEDTWNTFMRAHPEWDQPEDHDDLHTICMETVIMFRVELYERNNPGKRKRDDYDSAFARKEKARQNLTARRVDRVGTKSKGNHTINNIAVLAGQVTDQQMADRQAAMDRRKREEIDFLQRPTKRLEDLTGIPDVVDGEVTGTSQEVPEPVESDDFT